jgi:hypothetical protein
VYSCHGPAYGPTSLCLTTNADARAVFQFISSAIGIATAQIIFTNRLIESLPNHAPGIDAARVLAVGATGLRVAFPSSQLPGILRSYMIGLKDAWLMSLGLSGTTFIMSLLLGWKSLKTKKEASPDIVAVSDVRY